MKLKILAKKLLSVLPRIVSHPNDYNLIHNPIWIEKICHLFMFIKKLFPFYSSTGFLYYHCNRLKKLKENDENYNSIINNYSIFFKKSNDNVKMFMTQLFNLIDVFNDEICKMVMDFAMETTNKSYRYWVTMDISKCTFTKRKGFYSNFYKDRKELISRIAIENNLNIEKFVSKNDTICMICYLLDKNDMNSAHRVTKLIANGLSKYFNEIDVIVIDTFSPSLTERKSFTTLYKRKKSISFNKYYSSQFSNNVNVHCVKGNNYIERTQNALNLISNIAPKAILDISDEYSIGSYIYSNAVTTFYQPMRANVSSLFYSYFLGIPFLCEIENKQFDVIDINKVAYFIFPEYIPVSLNKYSRKQFNLEEDLFIIVSVGNNINTFSNKFIDLMCNYMKKNSRLCWIFIGTNGPNYIHQKYFDLIESRQIIEHGYEKDLYAFYSICNVFLRGDNTGGSGATAIAAMRKLPIVMKKNICDPSRWLGIDYSKITNDEEIIAEINKLYNNSYYYAELSSICYQKVNNVLVNENKWRELSELIKSKSNCN